MWSTLLTKRKNNNTENAMQHEASSTAKLAAMFFYFIFFFPSRATCRRVAYIGMLPSLSCFKLNSWASTPPPLLATMSQTLTSLMEGGKKHSVQRQRLAAIKCKKKKRKEKKNVAAAEPEQICWLRVFGKIAPMLQVVLQGNLVCLKKNCWVGSVGENWWLLVKVYDRMVVEMKCFKMCVM